MIVGHVHLQATGEVVTNKSKTHGNDHMPHAEALQLELVRVHTITHNVNKTTGYPIKVSPATVDKFMSGLQLVSLVLW